MADDKGEEPSMESPTKDKNVEGIQAIYTSEERSEYFRKLEKWLQDAYVWQSIATMLPYHLLAGQVLPDLSSAQSSETPLQAGGSNQQSNEAVRERPYEPFPEHTRPRPPDGYEYRIPPAWRRYGAEFIDSAMLFVLKLLITYVTVDLFPSVMEPQYLELLQANNRINLKVAGEMATRLLILELMFRLILCIYEAFWLQNGMNGTLGGATPGKFCMGLMVVQCESIEPIDRQGNVDIVFVTPGTDLGLPLAVGRSLVKHLMITFIFPLCFGWIFYRFNRTAYDLLCNSLVVEDPQRHANNRLRRA